MCGIAGAFGTNAVQQVQTAVKMLQHRGPEGEGFYSDLHVPLALGHRRLCIIDCSQAAAQPMRYKDRYVIVHNGELYNYVELKELLLQKGYAFLTRSDTEVIVAAYACWGKECLQQFDGAFAFAIWDEAEKMLFAARDRLGEKPFFYHFSESSFAFASEIKALWAAGIGKQVNESMLYNYLTLGYTTNPFQPNETFYQGVQQLPPATTLTYKAGNKELLIERYWQVALEEKEQPAAAIIDHFRALLTTSVRRRLRSDVPVGISLSGGLDSSTIAVLCATQAANNYTPYCFTASFPGFEKDETAQAAKLAAQLGRKHFAVPVGVNDLLRNMEQVARHQEAPVQSASVLAQWQVYEAAKAAGITVLLDGQGADELLAGYHKYYHWYWQELYAKKQLTSSGELQAAKQRGVQEAFGFYNKTAALLPHFTALLWQRKKAEDAARQKNLHPQFVHTNKQAFAYALPAQLTLNGVLHYNTFTNGLEELLRYADRNSMAHAVEVRLPFLYHELVQFLFTLPPSFKIRYGRTKWLLRETMKDLLPQELVWGNDKVGFEPPQQRWLLDASVQQEIAVAKQVLVDQHVLHPAVLQQKITTKSAHAANNMDWRYWSASYLYNR